MNSRDTLIKELEMLKEDLIQKYRELGMEASGQFADELEVRVSEVGTKLKGTLKGVDYTVQLSEGRAPGKFPPYGEGSNLLDWIETKGILSQVSDNISISSLAFLIARKIAREGTEYFKQGGTELISEVVTAERLQSIIDKVAEINVEFVVTNILDSLRKLSVAA